MAHNPSSEKISVDKLFLTEKHFFSKFPMTGAIVGIVALLLSFSLAASNPLKFFLSFHVSWLYFLSLAFGATFFVLIQFATKAGWSVVVRRIAENVSITIPLFIVLFPVIILGSHEIFHHWLSVGSYSDPVINAKRWYLNIPFLYGRSAFYLVFFTLASYYFSILSRRQDVSADHNITRKLQRASYPFLIILGFCVTFAAFDWIMSLDPHWYSTIFGLYFFASCYVAFLCFLVVVVNITAKHSSFDVLYNIEHNHDLGKLIFGHSCFWTYAAFVQYLLIWYGNIPEETKWYAVRQTHGWLPLWCLLGVGHFLVPFVLLMARRAKRSRNLVLAVSIWILVLHFIDLYWLIVPSHFKSGPDFSYMDLLCFVGIGSLFLSLFSFFMKRKAVVPVGDPRLPESLRYENF